MAKELFGALQPALFGERYVVEQGLARIRPGLRMRQEKFIKRAAVFLRENSLTALQQPRVQLGHPIVAGFIPHGPASAASF
jgi:hypothetical protein